MEMGGSMFRKSLALAALLTVVLLSPACSKKSTTADQPGGSATLPIATSSGGVSVGTVSLPDMFAEFPIPDGSSPVHKVTGGIYGVGFAVWFSSDKSIDELTSFFDGELPGKGWLVANKVSENDQANGSYTAYAIMGNGYIGVIYLGVPPTPPGGEVFSGDFAFLVELSPAQQVSPIDPTESPSVS